MDLKDSATTVSTPQDLLAVVNLTPPSERASQAWAGLLERLPTHPAFPAMGRPERPTSYLLDVPRDWRALAALIEAAGEMGFQSRVRLFGQPLSDSDLLA
jgi:hypothetical protein